jgi:zinc/manganese transport system substrate-binding protein
VRNTLHLLCTALACLLGALLPAGAVNVITSTTDLAAITRAVGGSRVKVESLAQPTQDLHRVEPRPSFVAKLSRADLVVRVGMDLDMWMDSLISAARNSNVRKGGAGYVDASAGLKALEVPTGKVDGSKGDIHIHGNPHYWLDPENGKLIARNILAGLKRVDPAGARTYQDNYADFVTRLDEKIARWEAQMQPLRGAKVVTYHTTWSYFNQRFSLKLAGTMEVKPGIPPSASHINRLIGAMKREGARIVMTTNYYPTRYTDLVTRETGAAILVLPTSVGGVKGADDYFGLFQTTIDQLLKAR